MDMEGAEAMIFILAVAVPSVIVGMMTQFLFNIII